MSYIIIISTKEKKKGGKKSTIFTILNFFTLKQEINFPRSIIKQKDFHFSHVITHPSSYPIYTYKNSIFLHSPNVTLKFLFFFFLFSLIITINHDPVKKNSIPFSIPSTFTSKDKRNNIYTHTYTYLSNEQKREKETSTRYPFTIYQIRPSRKRKREREQ